MASGSHNTHARRAPSDSERWTVCTNALDYEQLFRLACSDKPLGKEERDELHGLLERFGVTLEEARLTGYTSRDETIYNTEGTEAHDWAEKVLTGEVELNAIPEKFRDAVGTYVNECLFLASDSEAETFIESEVPLFYHPEADEPVYDKEGNITGYKRPTGTMDFAAVTPKCIRVRDYKHGAGIYVEVINNTQLAIYALSFIEDLVDGDFYAFDPDTEVEIGVVQPRHHVGAPVRLWKLTLHDLRAFCAEHIQKPHDIIDEGIDTVFAPGSACQWCRCKAFCGARLHHISQGLPTDDGRTEADFLAGLPDYEERGSQGKFEKEHPLPEDRIGIYTESYGVIPVDQLVAIYRNKSGITAFLNDVESYLTRLALEGRPAGGTKLVMGREGNTAWTDEVAAEKLLENQKFTKDERCVIKVISPTQAAALLGDKINDKKKNNPMLSPRLVAAYKALITRSPGKKVLALADDKRPAVESSLDGFADLDDDDPDANRD